MSAADFSILASASGVDDPVLSSLPQEQPILLIIDVSDDFDTTLAQIESFKQRYPAGRVAVLARQHQLAEMVSAFRLGANAYLVNVATCDTFIKSLELVMLGVTLLPPEILTFISDRQVRSRRATGQNGHAAGDEDDADADNGHADENDDGGDDGKTVGAEVGTNEHLPKAKSSYSPRLSARQQSILRCLIQGDSNKTIARKMAIAEATVKVHVKAILRRIRVHNRTQAAIWAMNNGPFISAKDDDSQILEELLVEPFPSLDVAQVLSAGHKNGSKSLPALQGTSHVGLPSIVRLVRKGIGRKVD
ncbi:MAG: response regulator transcription factor [Bradyrhizobium sp.]|uniref:response regulator transcription factor n=1 Tax=Bradyrhizobium sp. TaxID=376 RepID=UPI003C7D8ED1